MTDLRRHIPDLAIEWQLAVPERLWQAIDGTLCFADISGFTALAERLARQGRVGGEALIETLSGIFGAMLDAARCRDGMLLKFGGDALLFLFRGEGHAARAAATAVDMRATLRRASRSPTAVGRLRLSMSVGLHSGPVHFFLVGGAHRELVLAGEAATTVVRTEGAAASGEIAVSPATAALLPAAASRAREDGILLLRWRRAPVPSASPAPGPAAAGRDTHLRLFPAALCAALEGGPPEPGHRVACIGFGRFSGTDRLLAQSGPDATAAALQATVATVQEALDEEGISLLTIDIDKDGGKFFLASGVPAATEDDEGRMLRALRRIVEAGTPLPLGFGVNRGHVFVAEVGTPWRAAYSAMGDTTNTAARICARAPPGEIYAHPVVLDESRTLFQVRPEGPFTFKGKAEPLLVYCVGEEMGTRGREGRQALPLTGRDGELAALRRWLARLDAGTGGMVVVQGAMGLGKTRLIGEAFEGAGNASVMHLRAEPSGARSAYRVFRDPLRELLGVQRGAMEAMRAALEAGIRRIDQAVLASLMPWAALLGDVVHVSVDPSREVVELDPRVRPERTAEVVVQLLGAARPGPLVLVVDDAQWTDAPSSHLLAAIARECAVRPWLLIVARRPGEGGTALDGAVSETLEIGPLSAEASLALVTLATEAAPLRPHERTQVTRRAGGNPLFIEEILAACRAAGSTAAMPGSLEAAIAAQLDPLDEGARRLVRYAAVLGNSFRRSILAGVLAADGVELDAAALSRVDAFIEPEGDDHLRFRRALVRDTAYEGMAYRTRRRLHGLAGETTERAGGDVEANADVLAWHFSHAGDAGRTWRYARLSAERARRAYANPEAAGLYRLALDALRHVPGVPPAEQLQAWIALGDTCVAAGMFPDALAAYRSGSRLVRGDPVQEADLLRLRASARERAGAFSAALREIATGRRLLAGRTEPTARQVDARLASFASMLRFAQQRYREALREAEAAIAGARVAGEPAALAEALVAADSALLSLGRGSTGRMREALAIYESLGKLSSVGMVSGNLGCEAYLAGRWDEALDWFARDREIRQRTGQAVGAATAAANIGEILVKRGDIRRAEPLLREAARTMRATGYTDGAAYTELQLARALIRRGALDEAGAILGRVAAEFAALGQAAYALEAVVVAAHRQLALGAPRVALDLLDRAAASAGAGTGMLAPQLAGARAEAFAAMGDATAAARELDRGLEAARRFGLAYEEGVLLWARNRLRRAAGLAPEPADAEAAERLLGGLGVAMTDGAAVAGATAG